jgi:hypothetical protein
MEFLRDLFGSFTSGIIRLAVTVGILAAVYFFIVKPVLDTTNNAIDTANQSYQESFGPGSEFQKSMREARRSVRHANRTVKIQLHHATRQARKTGNLDVLANCMKAATPNPAKVQRCAEKFAP